MNEYHTFPTSPAALAEPLALNLMLNGSYNSNEYDSYELDQIERLEKIARDLNMVEREYLVKASKSVLLPAEFSAEDSIASIQFNNLDFEAQLITFSSIRTGRALGGRAIRGLCLTFDNVTLLPDRDLLPRDRHLHVPVYAVDDMDILKK